jgi:hypothetical protein
MQCRWGCCRAAILRPSTTPQILISHRALARPRPPVGCDLASLPHSSPSTVPALPGTLQLHSPTLHLAYTALIDTSVPVAHQDTHPNIAWPSALPLSRHTFWTPRTASPSWTLPPSTCFACLELKYLGRLPGDPLYSVHAGDHTPLYPGAPSSLFSTSFPAFTDSALHSRRATAPSPMVDPR